MSTLETDAEFITLRYEKNNRLIALNRETSMKHIAKLAALTALSLLFSMTALAKPETFAEIAEDPAKVAKKVWFGPDHASLKKIGQVGLPPRVGLLSFYLFDTGTYKFNAMAATYGPTYRNISTGQTYRKASESFGLTDKAANIFATEFAEIAVPKLKEVFAGHGMELLTPLEFIETEEQKAAYINFELPETGFQKFTAGALKFLDNNPHANAAADGFLMIPTHIFSGNRESLEALESLRQSLGLDAFVVVVNNTATDKKNVAYTGTQMLFYGPNPDPLPENKMQAKFWTAMIPYPSGTYGKGFKGISIYDVKKEVKPSYDGFDVVIGAIASESIAKMNKAIEKSKK